MSIQVNLWNEETQKACGCLEDKEINGYRGEARRISAQCRLVASPNPEYNGQVGIVAIDSLDRASALHPMSDTAQTVRQLSIKTGVVRRFVKFLKGPSH